MQDEHCRPARASGVVPMLCKHATPGAKCRPRRCHALFGRASSPGSSRQNGGRARSVSARRRGAHAALRAERRLPGCQATPACWLAGCNRLRGWRWRAACRVAGGALVQAAAQAVGAGRGAMLRQAGVAPVCGAAGRGVQRRSLQMVAGGRGAAAAHRSLPPCSAAVFTSLASSLATSGELAELEG